MIPLADARHDVIRAVALAAAVAMLAALLLVSSAQATQVTLRLVDQLGAGMAGSQFVISGQSVSQDGSVIVAPGTYPLTVVPAINGLSSESYLMRVDTVQVGAADTLITSVWHYADLVVTLVDQDGAPDDSVRFAVPASGPGQDRTGPTTCRLPVTVEQPGDPAYVGVYASGYDVRVFPSINDLPQSGLLRREELGAELPGAGLARMFIWKRAWLKVRVEDQDGMEIARSGVEVPAGVSSRRFVTTGDSIRLPVTEDPDEAPAQSVYGDNGYDLMVAPAIADADGYVARLTRPEPYAELTPAGATRTLVWKMAWLRVRVEDQDGMEIARSGVEVPAGVNGRRFVATGDSIRLPVTEDPDEAPAQSVYGDNGYDLMAAPAIADADGYVARLTRPELYAELTPAGATRTLVWKMAWLRVRVEDQDGTEIARSGVEVPAGVNGRRFVATGDSIRLPVTEDPDEAPAQSVYGDNGYDLMLAPAIADADGHVARLTRPEPSAELTPAGATRTLVWKMAWLRVRVEDQDGMEIARSGVEVPVGVNGRRFVATGDSIRLPVTEDPDEAPAQSVYGDNGYDLMVAPGIGDADGHVARLARIEPFAELSPAGATRMLIWRTAAGSLQVVDSTSSELTGSAFNLGLGISGLTGTHVSLPVTEDSLQTTIQGSYAQGYPAYIRPGMSGPYAGPFTLEIHPDYSITPELVTIDSVRYGLHFAPPRVDHVDPMGGGDRGSVTVTLSGSNLLPGAIARLSRTGQSDILGSGVTASADGRALSATLDLRGAAVGLWDVVVTNPDLQTATLPNGFIVESGAPYEIRVNVLGPTLMRPNRRKAFDIVLENLSNIDAPNLPLWVTGIPAGATVEPDFAIASPPRAGGEPDWGLAPLELDGPNGKYLALVIPRLPPGTSVRRLYLTVPNAVTSFTLTAALAPPWADGVVFRACLNGGGVISSPSCAGPQLTAIDDYLAGTVGVQALNGVGMWAKIAWQCEGAASLPAALAKAEQVLDFMLQPVEQSTPPAGCEVALVPRWRDRRLITIVTSVDPNDKLGAGGVGPQRLIGAQQILPYSIRFENLATATAPAQTVVVTDVLNVARLDVGTVSLGPMKFGRRASDGKPWTVDPGSGLTSYSADVDLRPEKNLIVRVWANLDEATGVLGWSLTALDPATMEIPEDPSVGFLPPNGLLAEGEGSLFFTVMPRAGLADGDSIRNCATINFDGTPQPTPCWRNAIDIAPPESAVLPLPANQDSASFTVRWQTMGSPPDLHDFSVYVSEDGSAFRPWRVHTTATADTFSGPGGRTYAFYSLARDSSGNLEPAPASPDVQTYARAVVDEAPSLSLSLEGAVPNPATAAPRVWFTLPSREKAVLEVMDVAGRRVFRREVGAMGPGRHSVDVSAGTRRPGLYFLRLAQGGRVLNARMVVVR